MFLEDLSCLDTTKTKQSLDATQGTADNLADKHSDICTACRLTIEDECVKLDDRRWHGNCFTCSQCKNSLKTTLSEALWSSKERNIFCRECAGSATDLRGGFERITRLKQYVFLLKVALARLLAMLRQGGNLPHTSGEYHKGELILLANIHADDPNLQNYDSSEGHKLGGDPPLLRSESRSKSFGGEQTEAYTNTVNDIRRLRSTRLDRQLAGSSAGRKARQSRIIEGPEADSVLPGGAEDTTQSRRQSTFRIVEDRDITPENTIERSFGDEKAFTLDDIARIVAVEQAREQRPNAFRHQHRSQNYSNPMAPTQPRLVNGHAHPRDGDTQGSRSMPAVPQELPPPTRKRYFSELTALDSFIVRHIAVLNIEPLVQGYFNLEELLGLIETNKKTFWGRFGEAFRPGEKKKPVKKKGSQ